MIFIDTFLVNDTDSYISKYFKVSFKALVNHDYRDILILYSFYTTCILRPSNQYVPICYSKMPLKKVCILRSQIDNFENSFILIHQKSFIQQEKVQYIRRYELVSLFIYLFIQYLKRVHHCL